MRISDPARGGTLAGELRHLAELRSDRDPIVSVALDARFDDEQQRDRLRLFVRDALGRLERRYAGHRDAARLGRSFAAIARYADALRLHTADEGAGGIALYVCDGLGLFERFAFTRRLAPSIAADRVPHLSIVLRALAARERLLLVRLDAHGGSLLEVDAGGAEGEERLPRTAHRKHHRGGWSQFRWERHVREQIGRNLQELAGHLVFLAERTPDAHVILSGPARETATFERNLPDWLAARVLAHLPNTGGRVYETPAHAREALLARALPLLEAAQRAQDAARIESVIGEALAGGVATLGVQDVLLAAAERRVHQLVLADDFEATGWRCRVCDALGPRAVVSCLFCGGEVQLVPALREELVCRVLTSDGGIRPVPAGTTLAHYGGIAAVLRHRGTRPEATRLGEADRHG